jgi:hypothetical protein
VGVPLHFGEWDVCLSDTPSVHDLSILFLKVFFITYQLKRNRLFTDRSKKPDLGQRVAAHRLLGLLLGFVLNEAHHEIA